jgi:hypothetical protein
MCSSPHFNLCTRCTRMLVDNFTLLPLYPGEDPRGRSPVLIEQQGGWAPGPVWRGVEKRKSLALHQDSGLELSSLYRVANRLRYPWNNLQRYIIPCGNNIRHQFCEINYFYMFIPCCELPSIASSSLHSIRPGSIILVTINLRIIIVYKNR